MTTPTARQAQAQKRDERSGVLRRIVLLLLLLFLIVYLLSVIQTASDFFAESAEGNALLRLSEDLMETDRLTMAHYGNLQQIADRLETVQSKEEVDDIFATYVGSPDFGDLRYCIGSDSYTAAGTLVTEEVSTEVQALAAARKQGAVLYFDGVVQQDCVAFFLPVTRTSFVDGVLSIVPIRDRANGQPLLDLSLVLDEDASAIALIGPSDRILLGATAEEFGSLGNNVQSFLSEFVLSAQDRAAVINALHAGRQYSQPVQSLNGEQYSISCTPIDTLGGAMLLGISSNDVLVAGEMVFIRHIGVLLIVAGAAFVAVLVYSVIYHKKTKQELSTAMLTDASIECPNVEQFRRSAIETVYSQKQTYAVLYYHLKRYHYMAETLGEQKTNEILRFVAKVFESFCTVGESYGYAGEGNFLLLNRYQSEKQLGEKVRLLEAVINKSDLVRSYGISVKFTVGVYLTSQGRRTLPQMIECAMLAVQGAKAGMTKSYVLYTDEVNREISNSERIEAQMEEALTRGDFKLFLQPKYNAKHDRIDSAEALVRWFDPEKGDYRYPAAFINLFEANGFIVKLDQFIYLEVLKYMHHAAERNEKIVPISVNVSRVTAMEEDFLDFYIGNKKKYQIGDDFLTLELTESFAMENYEKLHETVTCLHQNGIRCSIDDFGLGYSSFNTIKQIPFDEIKIDRLFLEEGEDRDRDDKIIRTIVQLAKDLGVSIVQEGVETEEMFRRVVDMGCEVIQGYYYARAIPLEEYRIFLNSNTSIQYKAKVK